MSTTVQHKPWSNDHDTDEYASKPCCTGVIYSGPTGAYVEVTEYDGGAQVSAPTRGCADGEPQTERPFASSDGTLYSTCVDSSVRA